MNKIHIFFGFFAAVVASLLLVGCTGKRTYFPKPSKMTAQHIDIVRFDHALMNVQRSSAKEDIQILYEAYPEFMPVFVEDILGFSANDTDALATALPDFLEDTVYGFKATNMFEQQLFENTNDLQKSLDNAFTKIVYLYPDFEIPTLYLYVSGFASSICFSEDIAGIGADMYLGSDYELYNKLVYNYQKQTMRKECIPVDLVSAMLFRYIPYTSQKSRLIDQMIYRGKIMYLLSVIFSDQPGWEIMGYTKKEWKWCEQYEKSIWNTMMDKRDLYKTEGPLLTSYLNDGPFTLEISQDSPGRLGTWVGWQIVESYMEKNTQVSLQQLMQENDAQYILENSYYRP